MKTTFYNSKERGHADHIWLDTYHSFNFGSFYDSGKMNFGALRVLNDDMIAAGKGFGKHPHNDMEIITIPLSGALAHSDSMGHEEVIRCDEVQVMTAGTGIEHAEFNHSQSEELSLLQIWIFPRQKGLTPRYDQKQFLESDRKNKLQTLVHPEKENQALPIHQDAWISRMQAGSDHKHSYMLHQPGNGVYVFLIDGKINIGDQKLKYRDALAIEQATTFDFIAKKQSDVLFIEVPMQW